MALINPQQCKLPIRTELSVGDMKPRSHVYVQIADEEHGEANPRQHTRSSFPNYYRLLLVLLSTALTICGYAHWMLSSSDTSAARSSACEKSSTRKEWRVLTISQKDEYLAAVQCLKTQPSKLGLNHTLYDDFPWIHSRIGEYGMPGRPHGL